MTGYVVTVVVVGAFAAIALVPPTRPRSLSLVGYLLGMVVNEVPHLAAGLALTTSTVLAVAHGHLGTAPGSWLALAGAAAVAWMLAVLVLRGVRAPDAVASGLRDGGFDAPSTPRGWALRTALTPIPWCPRGVVRTRNLRYGEHRRHRADVYHRPDGPPGAPVLLYLHGGGYHSGSHHHEGLALLHRLADRGWVCVSATYRLRPEVGFEEHLADARAALAWARRHAAGLGADPDAVVMVGSSAGAHLTSLCALEEGTALRAAIGMYGYYGRYYGRGADEAVPSTPFALSAGTAPPLLLAHGDRDTVASVEGTRRLVAHVRRESSQPVAEIVLPGGQHGFDLVRSWRYAAVIAGIEAFLADPRVGLLSSRRA